MKTTRAYVMIALSLFTGLLAVIFGARWLAEQGAMATRPVTVAARDLAPGSTLRPEMLESVNWPAGSIPFGSFDNPDATRDRVLRTGLTRGEAVLEGKLAPIGTQGGLSAVIGNGKRALTVKVNEVIGVAGFALPGNHVDVLVSVRDAQERPVSRIVLERILVLAVAQEAGRDETKPKVVSAVTLEVTPEQAERLDLARSVGSLSLALRNQGDQQPVETRGVRQDDLLHAAALAPATPAAKAAARPLPRPSKPAAEKVEIIRGLARTAVEM